MPEYLFRVFVAGQRPTSRATLVNLRKLCDKHLFGMFRIEVVDVLETPEDARRDQVEVVPAVLRVTPSPRRLAVGDLSNADEVVRELGLQPVAP